MMNFSLTNEQQTLACGAKLATLCHQGAVIFLNGDLGAGKTTFCRGVIQGFGYSGIVKSPTYTLVETYEPLVHDQIKRAHHFDLYRLGDPEELEYIGIRDYFDNFSLCLIEWPERGGPYLPTADITMEFYVNNDQGRDVKMIPASPLGETVKENITAFLF